MLDCCTQSSLEEGINLEEVERTNAFATDDTTVEEVTKTLEQHAVLDALHGLALPEGIQDSQGLRTTDLGWMNFMLEAMWPYLREVVIKKGKGEMLERMGTELSRHPEIHVKDMDVKFDPGTSPPKLVELHVIPQVKEGVKGLQLDVGLYWKTEEFIVRPMLEATFSKLNFTIDTNNQFPMTVSGVEVKGKISFVLAPLVPEQPCFGATQAFFIDPPQLKLVISGIKQKVPPTIEKMLTGLMKKMTASIMMDVFVLPHRVLVKQRHDIELETLVKVMSPLPLGVLELQVIEAHGLIASDRNLMSKSSDPFVEVRLGNGKIRTSTVSASCDPKWQDGPDYLFVYDIAQMVHIEVFDDDILTEDDLIGVAPGYSVYWLCQEAANAGKQGIFDLPLTLSEEENGKMVRKKAGKITLRVRYLGVEELDVNFSANSASSSSDAAPPPPRSAPALTKGGQGGNSEVPDGTPHLLTVRLLGLEGARSEVLLGSRAIVQYSPADGADHRIEERGSASNAKEHNQSQSQRGRWSLPISFKQAVQGGGSAFDKATEKLKAATGMGFGARELGVPNSMQSCKAMVWSEMLQGKATAKGPEALALSPMVVKAIEQLHRREGWDYVKIASMFNVSVNTVKVAAELRMNFDVVWHQALHYVVMPNQDPFSGSVLITVKVAPYAKDGIAEYLCDDYGVIGYVRLDLGNNHLLGHDTKWNRRVRGRLRRNLSDCEKDAIRKRAMPPGQATGVEGDDKDDLKGEGQCDKSLGDIIDGIMIEFVVQIRSMEEIPADKHLEDHARTGDKTLTVDAVGASRGLEVEFT